MNVVYESFESVDRLVKVLNARKNNDIMRGKKESENNDREALRFCGTHDYMEAENFLINGWDEPLEQIQKGVDKVNYMSTGTKQRPQNAIVGYIPNVPNALRGLPESMITIHRTPQKVRAITIYYAPVACGGTDKQEFIDGGIKMLSVINKLEASGIRVCLYSLAKCSQEYDEYTFCSVKIKDFRDKLDLKKICFPFVNASWLRRIGFKWLETCKGLTDDGWCCGYGRSVDDYSKPRFEKILREKKVLKDTDFFFVLGEMADKTVDEIFETIKK